MQKKIQQLENVCIRFRALFRRFLFRFQQFHSARIAAIVFIADDVFQAAARQARQDEADVLNSAQFQQYSTYKPAPGAVYNRPPPSAVASAHAAPVAAAEPVETSASAEAPSGYTPEQMQAWNAYYAQMHAFNARRGFIPPPTAAPPPPPSAAVAKAMATMKDVARFDEEEKVNASPALQEAAQRSVASKKAQEAAPPASGGLQWEEVTEDSLYSTSYRPASPENGQASTAMERKRKRDAVTEYDGIDRVDGDASTQSGYVPKRVKPTYEAPAAEEEDDDGPPLVWKKRDPSKADQKRNIRRRGL